MLVRVDGHLEALPSLAGAWEADLAVACELAHVGATAGWRWQALVPLEGEEAGAFSIARDVERAEYRFCEVTGRVRHACALEDMRRNRCDRAGSLELAPACLVPDGEGAWRAAAASACTPFYSRH